MTEPIQRGGELPDNDLSALHSDVHYYFSVGDMEAVQNTISRQIRLIGQFWTEVARLYEEEEETRIAQDRYGFGKRDAIGLNHTNGRLSMLRDILELSKKYPFG